MKIKTKFANWIFANATFPINVQNEYKFAWMLKHNCPCCLANPLESLSNKDYSKKYPANNILTLGVTKIYLCDAHYDEFKKWVFDIASDCEVIEAKRMVKNEDER